MVFFEILPGLPLAFELEPLGMLFALVASGLWIVTTCYSIGYMRAHQEKNQTRFYACFAIAIFAALGVAMAKNVLSLFIFYEVLTLSTYPLVTHHGDERAMRGGRTYLGVLLPPPSSSCCRPSSGPGRSRARSISPRAGSLRGRRAAECWACCSRSTSSGRARRR